MRDEHTFIYREMAKLSMIFIEELGRLYNDLMREYIAYREGDISQEEYLLRAKPIDRRIAEMEMSTLQGNFALTESFLQHVLKQEH